MSPQPADPARALDAIADWLGREGSLVSDCVVAPTAAPALGLLVAAGPRAASAPAAYARVVESVREGYLLHYGEPRVIVTSDRDLGLLAGDYMYACGLQTLASLGDLEAVRVLSDLIALSAHAHTDAAADVPALWLAAAVAIAAGDDPGHDAAKDVFRDGRPAALSLWDWASLVASRAGFREELSAAAETVGFQVNEHGSSGPSG